MIANGKHRRKRIFQLEQDDGTIVGQQNLKVYITEFYKKLFGAPEEFFSSMDETIGQDIPKLSEEENDILKAGFTEQEVKDAIFHMEKTRRRGLMAFQRNFTKSVGILLKKI